MTDSRDEWIVERASDVIKKYLSVFSLLSSKWSPGADKRVMLVYSMSDEFHCLGVSLFALIHLMQVVLLVSPKKLQTLTSRRFVTFDREENEASYAVERGAPVPVFVRVELELNASRLTDYDYDEPQTPCEFPDEQLRDCRNALIRMARKSGVIGANASINPISVDVCVDGMVNSRSSFFNGLKVLARGFCSSNTRNASWSTEKVDESYMPPRFDTMEFSLGVSVISPIVIASMKDFYSIGISVRCRKAMVDVDVWDASCREEDACEMFRILSATGPVPVEFGYRTIDPPSHLLEDEVDHGLAIRIILKAVATASSNVDLGGLFSQFSSTKNRTAIVRGIFESLLSGDSLVKTLILRLRKRQPIEDSMLAAVDAKAFTEQSAVHGNKLHLHTLDLCMAGVDAKDLHAIVKSFGDVKNLTVTCGVRINRETYDTIFGFPRLRQLKITCAALDSFDVFNSRKSVLTSLNIQALLAFDKASLHRFIASQKPENGSNISKSLESFSLGRMSLDAATVDLLNDALGTNNTLSFVQVSCDDRQVASILQKQNGRLMPEKDMDRRVA